MEDALDGLLAARRAATLAGRPFTSPPIATGAGGASVGVVEPEGGKRGTRGEGMGFSSSVSLERRTLELEFENGET